MTYRTPHQIAAEANQRQRLADERKASAAATPYQRPALPPQQPLAPPAPPRGWDAHKSTSMAAIDARVGRKPR